MRVTRLLVKQDSIYEWVIRRAEDWHDYYEIPVELAGPYLAAQRDADLFKRKILEHIEEHHLRDQPAENPPNVPKWPDDYTHVIECTCLNGEWWTSDDTAAWQREKVAHRSEEHDARAYSVRREAP